MIHHLLPRDVLGFTVGGLPEAHGSMSGLCGAAGAPTTLVAWILRFSHRDTALERLVARGPVEVRGPVVPRPRRAAAGVQPESARHPPPSLSAYLEDHGT